MTTSTPNFSDIIKEIDNLPCSHPASVNTDVANYYYSLTKVMRPLLTVEIGCFIGFSTLHFAKAIKEQGFGKMISIDPFDWDVDTGKEARENRENVARRYLKKADMEDVVTYVKGTSETVYPEIEERIKGKIDLLYIDGDHSVKGAFYDFNRYYNDVRPGGIIILHDIYPQMCGCFGPRAILDSLKRNGHIGKNLDLIELPGKDGFGISVLRKNRPYKLKLGIPFSARPKSFITRVYIKLRARIRNRFGSKYKFNPKGPRLTIIDEATGNPIHGALFVCEQRWDEKRHSNFFGHVFLDHYLPNRYEISILAKGYAPIHNYLLDIEQAPPKQHFTIGMQKVETEQPAQH